MGSAADKVCAGGSLSAVSPMYTAGQAPRVCLLPLPRCRISPIRLITGNRFREGGSAVPLPTPDPPDLVPLLRKEILSESENRELFDRFRPPCERFLRSKFSSSIRSGLIDVEEVFHDAFVKFLMVGRQRITDPGSAQAYLFTTCKRLALDILRRKCIPTTAEEEGEAHQAGGNPGTHPAVTNFTRSMENREFVEAGLRILKEENGRYHDILVMTYFQEMTPEEICRRLRITRGNYYVIIMRAKQNLKIILNLMQTRGV